MLLRNFHQNGFDIFAEAHIQHFVRFIQNHHLYGFRLDGSSSHVIHHAPGCTDDNLCAFSQCGNLSVDRLSAINGQNADVVLIFQQLAEFLAYLNRQLSGGAEDERLQASVLGVNAFQKGNPESSGFACPCLRLSDDVLAF